MLKLATANVMLGYALQRDGYSASSLAKPLTEQDAGSRKTVTN